jgi:RimJ/RimL family protein N-acetyltransferase
MPVALRAFQPPDIQRLDQWAVNIGIDDFMSRSRPKVAAATSHDPSNGLLWFVITDADIDIGTVWLEPSEQPKESILGIFLGDQSAFGRGIGSQAIRLALSELWALYPSHNVTLNVRQANSRAIACYKKIGFSITSDGFKISPKGVSIPLFQMQLKPCFPIA